MRKYIYLIYIILSIWGTTGRGQAANVYVTQSGASAVGCTLTPRYSVTQFNDVSNWGTGGTQIGPGSIVHLCGTLTQEMDIRGSGTSTNKITLLFESGAKWLVPVITGDQAIYSGGNGFIVLDGGTPCGKPTDTCNGQIGTTANGTGLANHIPQTAIMLTGAHDWEIKNLNLGPLFNRTSTATGSDNNPPDDTFGTLYANGYARIHVHDSQLHDEPWAINLQEGTGDLGVEVDHNYFYRASHGGAFFHSNSSATSNIKWHDNVIDGPVNWDGTPSQCSSGGAPYHHDGIHIASTGPGTFNTFIHYNNWYRGDWGLCNTSAVFIENNEGQFGNITGIVSFNNVYQDTNTVGGWNDGINLLPHGGLQAYNETIICAPAAGQGLTGGGTGTSEQNLIVSGCSVMNDTGNQATIFTTLNNNLYVNFVSNGNQPFKLNGNPQDGAGLAGSFATWKSNTGKEVGSLTGTTANLNANGAPQTGSVAINAGANLTSLCSGNLAALCSDTSLGGTRSPVARPATGNWTIGAYQFGGSVVVQPNPPTGVVATPN